MMKFATCLWDANYSSFGHSKMYTELWVERLYRGIARNYSGPFKFYCFVDRERAFAEDIKQVALSSDCPTYSHFIETYSLGGPLVIMGLDTVIVGNITDIAGYALGSGPQAVPRDPFHPDKACNAVAVVPAGNDFLWDEHRGQNDMEWVRANPHVLLDDLFPGQIVSYKGFAKANGIEGVRIVYFHGAQKPHELGHLDWIKEHWR